MISDPLKKRREELEESLRFHTYNFEVDNKLQWIREREPAARSETLGRFEDFKLRIAVGSESFGHCDAIAIPLIASENHYAAAEFPAKQEELR